MEFILGLYSGWESADDSTVHWISVAIMVICVIVICLVAYLEGGQ